MWRETSTGLLPWLVSYTMSNYAGIDGKCGRVAPTHIELNVVINGRSNRFLVGPLARPFTIEGLFIKTLHFPGYEYMLEHETSICKGEDGEKGRKQESRTKEILFETLIKQSILPA